MGSADHRSAWRSGEAGLLMATYKIVRFYQDPDKASYTVVTGQTEEQAKRHCSDPESNSQTATSQEARDRTALYGAWFDGYLPEG